jgi:hypothetical protein
MIAQVTGRVEGGTDRQMVGQVHGQAGRRGRHARQVQA